MIEPQDTFLCERCGTRWDLEDAVIIPKYKLREWRRGLMTFNELLAQHAHGIKEEIEAYLK